MGFKPGVDLVFSKPPLVSDFESWNIFSLNQAVDRVLTGVKVRRNFFYGHQCFHLVPRVHQNWTAMAAFAEYC